MSLYRVSRYRRYVGVPTPTSRFHTLTDQQWNGIASLLPSSDARRGRAFIDSRRVVNGIVHRYRTGILWRDLLRDEFGPWQTVWKRHRRYSADGTWDKVLAHRWPTQ